MNPATANTGSILLKQADRASVGLIFTMLILAPWLFGTTEDWAVWTMNALSYGAGFLLLIKQAWRLTTPIPLPHPKEFPIAAWLPRIVFSLMVLLLLFTLLAALNARANYVPDEFRFDYYNILPWLPSSYDRRQTWFEFWRYLGLACFFWALRDVLLRDPDRARSDENYLHIPNRMRRLLWIVALNGAVVSVVGIFFRLAETGKVLGLRESWWGTPESLFGPFAYRGNASSYLNLAWPAALGLWWTLREEARTAAHPVQRIGGAPHIVLLPCVVLMAAGPMIASSRAGALVMLGALLAAAFILCSNKTLNWQTRAVVTLIIASVLIFGGNLGWETLGPRFRELMTTEYANRNEIFENAKQMAIDFPVYGIGPGAAGSLYQLYRSDPSQPWHAYLHNDWLEMQVSFGWVGSMMIMLLLALIFARWFIPVRGIPTNWELIAMLWIAIGGCLVHAIISFPLQVYSIQQLFVTWACVLKCSCRPRNLF